MFCSNTGYKSQKNWNYDQFCYFEIAIIFVSMLHRKLCYITAVGMGKADLESSCAGWCTQLKWKVGLFFLWNRAVHSKVATKIKIPGWKLLVWGLSIKRFGWAPCPLKKRAGARTPKDTSGFLPLKLKLDATSKLLSCPFFVAFIYVFLSASHLLIVNVAIKAKAEHKQHHKPGHNF